MTDFYELRKSKTVEPGGFGTAALIVCGLCAETIDGMGGPGHGPVCKRCGDELIAGRLRGAVIWSETADHD